MNEELEKVIFENKNLILKIASKFKKYYSMEDLFQVGVIGLIKAYNNYDKNKNAKFSTYSVKYIYGEMLEFIRNDRTMKVSPDAFKIYKSYEKTKEFLTSRNGCVPSITEISLFMGIDLHYLSEIIERCQFVVSLDAPLNVDEFTLEKVTGVDNTLNIDKLLDIKRELENLKEEERKLIELRYFNDYTQSETAQVLGINQVQVSRYEKLILKKMNKSMAR